MGSKVIGLSNILKQYIQGREGRREGKNKEKKEVSPR